MESISGHKVVLRAFRPDDTKLLYRAVTDPQVARYLDFAAPENPSAFTAFLQRLFANRTTEHSYVVAARESDRPLGLIRLSLQSPKTAELSFWLGKPHWAKGFAFEAAGIVCTLGFVNWGLEEILAHTYAGNVRSIALLDRLGFATIEATAVQSADPLLGRELLFRLTLGHFSWKPPLVGVPQAPPTK